jgi:hypothetical protein
VLVLSLGDWISANWSWISLIIEIWIVIMIANISIRLVLWTLKSMKYRDISEYCKNCGKTHGHSSCPYRT